MDIFGISLVANILIVFVVFGQAQLIHESLGKAGSKAVGKIVTLFLADITVISKGF